MPPYNPSLSIKGLQEAQERNLRRIAALQPSGVLGQAVRWAAGEMHRWLTYFTPWETGALRASRRITYSESGDDVRAQIFDSRNSYNPRSSTPPHEYDVYLHQRGFKPGLRGGIQASYEWTRLQKGSSVVRRMHGAVRTELRGI
jgi:hypothetical protein